MDFEDNKRAIILGLVLGGFICFFSLVFVFVEQLANFNIFLFVFVLGLLAMFLPFVFASSQEQKIAMEKSEMFLEFSRALVESVQSGTPIGKSIVNLSNRDFGALSPHIKKLANQILIGVPLQKAFKTFAEDTGSSQIVRAITLIREADKTGGDVESILNSVAESVSTMEKLKAERRAGISSIISEGYIIFFIFIVIMIIVEMQILPITAGMGGGIGGIMAGGIGGFDPSATTQVDLEGGGMDYEFTWAFVSLLVTQGFFTGIVIGLLSEADAKAGIKHSFILVAMALLLYFGAKVIF